MWHRLFTMKKIRNMNKRLALVLFICSIAFSFKAQTYFVLQKKLDGGYYEMPSGGILNFKFTEEYPKQASPNLSYKIYDDNYVISSGCNPPPTLTEVKGDNRFQVNLGSCGLTTGNYYIIEVFNEKKERWVAKFKYN